MVATVTIGKNTKSAEHPDGAYPILRAGTRVGHIAYASHPLDEHRLGWAILLRDGRCIYHAPYLSDARHAAKDLIRHERYAA